MLKHIKRSLSLAVVLLLVSSSVSMALPIEPIGSERLDYLELIMDVIEEYYVEEIDSDILVEGAFRGVFDQLDQYSAYFSPEEFQRYNEDAGGAFGGVGITVTKDEESDYILVISPIEDTPGDRAGIQTNDLIIGVNGNSLKGFSLEEAVKLMRGEPGTKLRLSIQRKGLSDPIEVDIIREVIKVNPVNYEIREDGVVNFRLKSFNENSAKDVRSALEDIRTNDNVKGIVIDLRNNPGGRLDQVIDIADMFLEVGEPIVQVDYRAYSDNVFNSESEPLVKLPLAVLINEGSASASEILAGALQDNDAATVIGMTSFGKGTVQSVTDLSNGGGIKLTIAEYLTGNGNKVNGVGITPDIEVNYRFRSGELTNLDFAPMVEDEDNVFGEVGLNVYGAQERLDYLGYEVTSNGVLDEETQKQIRNFQKENGLMINGVLNSETRVKLFSEIDKPVDGLLDIQFERAVEIILEM